MKKKINKSKRAVIYARVSTEKMDQQTSTENQVDRLEKLAKKEGYEVVAVEQDMVSGAKDYRKRKLGALIEKLNNGEADVLLVTSLDRMTRNAKDGMIIWEMIEIYKWQINSDGRIFDGSDDQFLYYGILVLQAADMRRKSNSKVKKALDDKKKRGEKLGGHLPVGYKKKGKLLVADKDGQKVISSIKRMRANGRSYKYIADYLNKKKVETVTGALWSPRTISRVYKRECLGKEG